MHFEIYYGVCLILFLFLRDISVGLTTPRVRAHRAAQQTKTPDVQKPWRPWKKKTDDKSLSEKLLIPLPVPHPVHIAINIYNRDAEHPIPLDSELVWEILKSIEDCQSGDAMVDFSFLFLFIFFFFWEC